MFEKKLKVNDNNGEENSKLNRRVWCYFVCTEMKYHFINECNFLDTKYTKIISGTQVMK